MLKQQIWFQNSDLKKNFVFDKNKNSIIIIQQTPLYAVSLNIFDDKPIIFSDKIFKITTFNF